jgi:hypothetical protein
MVRQHAALSHKSIVFKRCTLAEAAHACDDTHAVDVRANIITKYGAIQNLQQTTVPINCDNLTSKTVLSQLGATLPLLLLLLLLYLL